MKKQLFIIGLLTLGFYSHAVSQSKSYETKFTTTNAKVSGVVGNTTNLIVAGDNSYNIIQTTDGTMLNDKTFSSTGVSIDKADIIQYCEKTSMLIVGNTKTNTISAIEVNAGSKKWELSTFINLKSAKFNIYDGYLLVSESKDKKNNALTCFDINTGNKLWSLENEPNLITSVFYLPEEKLIYIPSNTDWAYRNKTQNIRFISIDKGNLEFSVDVTGWIASSFYNKYKKTLFIHNLIQETNSSVSCISLTNKSIKWTTKATNKTSQTPILIHDFYSSFSIVNNNVILITDGIEAFDLENGTQKYNVAYRPYVPSGPGHYTDGIFSPIFMDNSIIIADGTKGDISIKNIDINTGKVLWVSEPQKGKEFAPMADISMQTNSVIIQFGGVCNFVSQKNAGTTSLQTPCSIVSFDLNTGKKNWGIDYKKGVFVSGINKDNVIAFSGNEIQTIDLTNGTVTNTATSPFDEKVFITKSAWVKKYKKSGENFDFQNRLYNNVSTYSIKQIEF